MADDTAGSVTMTIAGMMVPLLIGPHAINNLLIQFDFIHILFPFFSSLFSLSPLVQPSSSPFCSFSSPPSSSLIPASLLTLLSLDAPSSSFRSAAASEQVATANLPSFLYLNHSFFPRTCSPHFHMFKHSHPILATPPSSSSSSSSSSFSPALLSSEF